MNDVLTEQECLEVLQAQEKNSRENNKIPDFQDGIKQLAKKVSEVLSKNSILLNFSEPLTGHPNFEEILTLVKETIGKKMDITGYKARLAANCWTNEILNKE